MELKKILENIKAKNIELWIEGNDLCYRAPEHVSVESDLNELKKHKIKILELLKKGDYISKTFSLSRGQEALYFIHQINPKSAAYNIGFAIKILSELDVEAIQKALQSIIERHASLRTAVVRQEDGKLIQNVYAYKKTHFEKIDASNWNESEFKRKVQQTYEKPFDLSKASFFRASLFTKLKKEHILLLTIHHTVFDGSSLWMILDELEKLYIAHKNRTKAELSRLNASYADFASWQTDMLESPKREELWNYWKERLSGELPVLDLPTDYPGPGIQTFNGATYTFALDKKLAKKIEALAKKEGVTLFMLLLAAYQVLLHRLTSQDDIIVASPTAGRSQKRFANVSGYFVNPVVMRADFSKNPCFKDFLIKTRETVLGAIKHQDYPFINLVEKLQIKRDVSCSPIAQTGFVLQQPQEFDKLSELLAGKQIKWADLDVSIFELAQQEGQEDLQLEMLEAGESFLCALKYNTDLFKPDTIERMAGHFETLLEGIVANPEQKISDLPILTEEEKHKILVEWNDTYADYPKNKCIHELFEEQVLKTPDAVAVVFEDKQLTYAELNAKANQLAHYLQSLGVKPETLVGISVERSLEMIIGLLGILKAGGAYVPLDPEYPQERLSFMLEDTKAPILLTQAKLLDSLPENKAKLICLDTDWKIISKERKENVKSGVKPDNLAYVIYTSGSTGMPKGVMIEHKGIGNMVNAQIRIFDIFPDSKILQFASFCFDASISEVFIALCSASALVLMKKDLFLPGEPLLSVLRKEAITHVTLPPSALSVMSEIDLPNLHTIIIAGEACPAELANLWSKKRRFINAYGPTEVTVCVTAYEYTEKEIEKPPIGKPISNTQIYILNEYLEPVPIGIAGEIHISGAGLARGYLNRPELTAEKFIPNPFNDAPDSRLYKTGDLARYLPDGNIEFLGRIDHQVKIRGFRIELGEIESVLSKHDKIKGTVVTAREDIPCEKRLVAYIVPAKEKEISISELREFLKKRLPDYMIPSAFVVLDTIPLTSNGKIDRKALPAPDLDLMREHEFTAPRNETEKIIAEIWKELLNIKKVSMHDNFFEIGGNSLLLVRVHSKLQDRFNFSIIDLFQYPTIHSLNLYLTGEPQDFSRQSKIIMVQKKELIKKQRAIKRKRHVNRK